MRSDSRLVAGRYRLEERIGSGAMGVVWRARDERLDRVVAIKQLLLAPGLSAPEAEQSRARAMREGRIAARLQHSHAISVFDVALDPDDGGDPWLVMEYLPSTSLAALLAERGPLPPRQAARIGRQVADALAAAHDAGIVHRDVKPGNVLLGAGGAVKITDFGISRASWDVTVTRTGVLAGTPAYFAPEVARGETPSPASDVFSLGSTLYAAVEGEPPFGVGDNTLALLRAVSDGQVRPPRQAGALSALLMQLLQQQPAHRPTMLAARDRLGAVADGGEGRESRPVAAAPQRDGATPAASTRTRSAVAPVPSAEARRPAISGPAWWRRPQALLGAAAVLLLLLGAVALATLGGGDGRQQGVAAGPTQGGAAQPATSAPETTVAPPLPGPQQLERTVREYYGLLPGDTDAAWEYLDEQARQQSGGRAGYERFWSGIERIRIDGPIRVEGAGLLLNLRFDPERGDTSYERYRLTMTSGPHGRVLIQSWERIGFYGPGDHRADVDRGRGDGGDGNGGNVGADGGDGGADGGDGGERGRGPVGDPGRGNGGERRGDDGDDGDRGRGPVDNPGRGNGGDEKDA